VDTFFVFGECKRQEIGMGINSYTYQVFDKDAKTGQGELPDVSIALCSDGRPL